MSSNDIITKNIADIDKTLKLIYLLQELGFVSLEPTKKDLWLTYISLLGEMIVT